MRGRFFYLPLLTLLFHSTLCWGAEAFSVRLPPEKSFVENKKSVNFVLTLEKGAVDAVRILNGERKVKEIPVKLGSKNACFPVELNKGLNTIELLGLLQGKVRQKRVVKIFFRSDLFPAYREPPGDYKRYYFHLVEREKECGGCHDMEPTLSSLRPATPQDSPCYSCHKGINVNAFKHYPTTQWTCFTCHEVLQKGRKYTIPHPNEKVCYPCHNSQLNQWKSRKIMHGPTAVGTCTLCHNPHGSSYVSLLRMQTTDLCINCHEDKASGAHVIAGFYGKGHPVRDVKDPFRPEREFTCAGCHNPHAGDTQNLLNHDNSNLTVYCSLCHKM